MPDLRMKQFMNQYVHGRYRGGNKVSRELFFSDFVKFSEVREKLFCENLESYLIVKVNSRKRFLLFFSLYGFF